MLNSLIRKVSLVVVGVAGLVSFAFSQQKHVEIQWEYNKTLKMYGFPNCDLRSTLTGTLPWYTSTEALQTSNGVVNVQNMEYENFHNDEVKRLYSELEEAEPMNYYIGRSKDKRFISVELSPYRIVNGQLQRLKSFDLIYKETGVKLTHTYNRSGNRRWTTESVLANGDWFKLNVSEDGIYKLDKGFLESLGMDLSNVDPRTIKLFGNHGGMLSDLNSDFRYDDLLENAIQITGETDGVFDDQDYILFYGEAADKWIYDNTSRRFDHKTHLYSKVTSYFITYGGDNGKRIQTQAANNGLSHDGTVSSFDDFTFHEKDEINHLKSGRKWYGETFDVTTEMTFTETFPNLITNEELFLKTIVVARSLQPSGFEIKANGSTVLQPVLAQVFPGETNPRINFPQIYSANFLSNSDEVSLDYKYFKSLSSSVGWLDYYELHAKRELIMTGDQMRVVSIKGQDYSTSKYVVRTSVGNDYKIWNVSDPFSVKEQNADLVSGNKEFKSNNNGILEKYILFEENYRSAEAVGKIENQNLHGAPSVEYIVITHPDFVEAAQRLVDYRATKGMSGMVATTTDIFNEYSSGTQDVVAMRDFIRSVYVKASGPQNELKHVLLFGDGSYDYKDKLPGNNNFVPTYESVESFNPTTSYCSNDFFGFMDSTEGEWINGHIMDIGLGRIPVNSLSEAQDMVDKILHYESNKTLGDWRNRLVYAADDSDLSWDKIHLEDAEDIFDIADQDHKVYNNRKIYMDAYVQQSLGGSSRYPEATLDFNKFMEQGALVFNYTGHGGEQGLAQESLIDVPTVNSWENMDNMPLFITATCEFSRYDDPSRFSAGELSILNENGGMIALMTTVRVVYATPNKYLNQRIWIENLLKDSSEIPTIGDIFKKCKNGNVSSYNDRNFTLLGDPAMKLAYPNHNVKTDSINGTHILSFTDTIQALQKVTITGHLENKSGTILSNFSGVVFPTVFDKPKIQRTLMNDANSVLQEFEVQQDIIYKGKAQVVNGLFSFSFIVPKDINYQYGFGKISYYAEDGTTDGHGFDNSVIIGGSNPNAAVDTEGPEIELWMDDYSFINGGTTGQSPLLIARVKDASGINTAGSGIGREITAVLDDETENEELYILNDYYESDLNSYQEGEVRFRLEDLNAGEHNIKVKFWDTYNNSSEESLEFIVSDDAKLALRHVLNYPNPFTTNTTFHFDHNKSGQDLDVVLQILTISGKVVKTFHEKVLTSEAHFDDLSWDGKDEYGDTIGRGVYMYKITVKSEDGNKDYKYEKLVILN
jgi:hypothetical protein